MKIKITAFLLLFLPYFAFSQGFHIVNGQLKDANENTFILKGINVPLAWYQSDVLANIKNIKKQTGSNTLRIVVGAGITPLGGSGMNWNTPDAIWQAAVDSTIKNHMIPMLEVHNILGSNDSLDVKAVTDWWITKKDYLTRPDIAKYLLINIANEWGDWAMTQPSATAPNQAYWRDTYITSVKRLRAAGITTTLVIDAPGYGQDKGAATLLNQASAVFNADPAKNVLFSIHAYCEWNTTNGAKATTVFPQLQAAKIPFIVGEFADTAPDGVTATSSCQIPAEQIMATSVQYNSGYIGWSWKGNSGGTEALDMSSDWAGTQLTTWGSLLVNSAVGTKTAVEASVFGGTSTNKMPTVHITSPLNNASFSEPASIKIDVTAADSDGTVKRVDFYQGSTKIGQDTSAPYSFTWTNVGKGTYSFTAFVLDNENGSGISNSVSVLVTSANGNTLANGDFESGTSGWEFQATAPGTGTMTLATDASMAGQNSLRICPTNPGTADYHVMVVTKASIVKGNTYEISFLAKADTARTIKVGFQQNGGTWKWYTGAEFSITTSSELYSYSFVADTTDPAMDIKFFVGLRLACVNIDNVIFSSNTIMAIEEDKVAASVAFVYPNPFTEHLSLQSKGDFRYEIRNQIGQLVEQGTGTDGSDIAASLSKGFYLLRVTNGSHTWDTKIIKE
jgi:hypothetical protein